jgi:hypothetical protein
MISTMIAVHSIQTLHLRLPASPALFYIITLHERFALPSAVSAFFAKELTLMFYIDRTHRYLQLAERILTGLPSFVNNIYQPPKGSCTSNQRPIGASNLYNAPFNVM